MAQSIQNICYLPPELLEQIFSWLEDGKDFQSVINTCPLWHDIMEYRKAEKLFAQVLPILMEEETRRYPLNNMLALRQVCKEWKQETDRQLALARPDRFDERFDSDAYSFYGAEKMQRFLMHASALPDGINPILGNFVSFIGVEQQHFGLCMQLIRGYGTYIKSIDLGAYTDRFPIHELQLALTFLPNLEYMFVNTYVEDWTVGYQVLTLPPLPLLKDLCLQTQLPWPCWSRADYLRHQQLIDSFVTAYGPHLESLSCCPLLLRLESISDRLPNLTSLEIEGMRRVSFTEEDIHTLSQANCQLQRLVICSFGAPTIQCSTALMEMLNNFSETLVSLHISIQLERSLEPSDLNVFPNLERVSLRVSSTFSVFLAAMRNRLNLFSAVCPNLKSFRITTVGTKMNAAVRQQLQFAQMERVFQQLQEFTHRRYESDVYKM
ncbi:unnamed protein product [Orchesella dallaii]|uniref:F-box domain-containing protein n=1 Tax=Orchesella dallaii TaxID=48710 RepID=A0ABP1RYU9_9HEXA